MQSLASMLPDASSSVSSVFAWPHPRWCLWCLPLSNCILVGNKRRVIVYTGGCSWLST